MTNEQKQKWMEYLFPNKEIRHFLCNDLFQEMSSFISDDIIFGDDNKNDNERNQNSAKLFNLISDFIENNPPYQKMISKYFGTGQTFYIINDLIIGYAFFLAETKKKFEGIDIFKDACSVCRAPIALAKIFW